MFTITVTTAKKKRSVTLNRRSRNSGAVKTFADRHSGLPGYAFPELTTMPLPINALPSAFSLSRKTARARSRKRSIRV